MLEFLAVAFGICVLLAGYIAWRDRRRGRGHGHQRFVEHGEGKSAAYAADLQRGIDGAGS